MEKNFYFRQSSLLMLFALFLVAVSLIGCGEQGDDGQAQLTPEALYQTSWRGMGHCDGWTMKEREISMQFIDTRRGKVIWKDYDEFDITYVIEGKYITFNDVAFQLAGAPWVIKSYTGNHLTLIQNEASPNKRDMAIIELDKVN
ncbi:MULTISPECIES: hypothetical protein [unclassified Bacteroides]|uniref:hypothetical protein n=2 Tax=Bacteroides TaxID=816 RepID=UPI003D7FB1F9